MATRQKQIMTIDIKALADTARLEGNKTNCEIARWIINSSVYWRSKGYIEILKALDEK